jgi:hypothetical protein
LRKQSTADEVSIREISYKDDSDVEEEREKIESGELRNSMVVIEGLNKMYGGLKAVNNLSFSIQVITSLLILVRKEKYFVY